jgi:nucleotide-binding universal stress UspA family protein
VAIDGPEVVRGAAAEVIAGYATRTRADLVVLGTRGLGLDPTGRLGSVADEVARRISTPILLVPPAVWETYAKA